MNRLKVSTQGIVKWARRSILGNPLWFGVSTIAVVLAIVGAAFPVLESQLSDTGRYREVATVIQAAAAATVILVGGIFALYRFQVFRVLHPHLSITHQVSHRIVGGSYVHIGVTATLHNSSRVKIELGEGFFALLQIAPYSKGDIEDLYSEVFLENRHEYIQWKTLERIPCEWGRGALIIEPGEKHKETREFIVKRTVATVGIITYFRNPEYSEGNDQAEGWQESTFLDIVDHIGLED